MSESKVLDQNGQYITVFHFQEKKKENTIRTTKYNTPSNPLPKSFQTSSKPKQFIKDKFETDKNWWTEIWFQLVDGADVVVSGRSNKDGGLNLDLSLHPNPEGIEEGRKKKNQDGMQALIAAAIMKAALLKALAFKALVFLVGKALLVSKVSGEISRNFSDFLAYKKL